MHRIFPLKENRRLACPGANANEVSKDSLGCILPNHKEHASYDLLIDGIAFATERLA